MEISWRHERATEMEMDGFHGVVDRLRNRDAELYQWQFSQISVQS